MADASAAIEFMVETAKKMRDNEVPFLQPLDCHCGDKRCKRKKKHLATPRHRNPMAPPDPIITFLSQAVELYGGRKCDFALCDATARAACTGCHVASYCSKKCQDGDWRNGHKDKCKEMAEFAASYSKDKLYFKGEKEGRPSERPTIKRVNQVLFYSLLKCVNRYTGIVPHHAREEFVV